MDNISGHRRLLGLTLAGLQGVASEVGLPGFAAKQMAQWLYDKRGCTSGEMPKLPKAARARLAGAGWTGGRCRSEA